MTDYLKRYKIIFPSEHGSWSLMLVPFIIGAGVAAAVSQAAHLPGLAVALCLLAVFAVFFARQPINLLIRIQRGKGPASRRGETLFWSALLLVVGSGAGAGLLALNRWPILWLAIPALIVLILTLLMTVWRGPRQLSVELIGVVGLALAAPAAYVSVTGRLDTTAWLVWLVSALHSVIDVLYVRLRVDENHERATHSQAVWVVLAHIASLLVTVGLTVTGWLPWLVALPLALLLVRALVVAIQRPRIEDVRRFGFTEMGLSLVFALMVIAAFVLLK